MKELVLSVCLVLLSTTAMAQQTGTRIGDGTADYSLNALDRDPEVTARRTMSKYATCVVNKRSEKVREALRLFPKSSAEQRKLLKLAIQDCLAKGELTFVPALFRSALFEAMYKSDFRNDPIAGLAELPPIDYAANAPTKTDENSGLSAADISSAIALRQFADCVVRADPVSSRTLIMTDVASADENAAFAELSPKLGPCLPETLELAFGKPVLRGLLAETLYRLSVNAELGSR